MFANHLKIMLRNLVRQKAFSAINILGLAIGIACCLLILMFVRDELSYDKFHVRGDGIYRLNSHSTITGTIRRFAMTPAALAPAVKAAVPEVQAYARMFRQGRAQFQYEGRNIDIPDAYAADPDFFTIFSFEFLAGDPAEALRRPRTFVVTERAANLIFGSSDALGRTITVGQPPQGIDLTVGGVIRDVPRNSHLPFEIVISTETFRAPQPVPGQDAPPQNAPAARNFLDEFYSFAAYSYLLVDPGTDVTALDAKIRQVVETNWGDFLRQRGVTRWYEPQNLHDIHLRSSYEAEPGTPGNIRYVYLFGAVAAFVLFIAAFNFVNLSTARATLRAKEVGLRKVFGAERRQLVRQFLAESFGLSVLGMLLSLVLVLTTLPAFNAFAHKDFGAAELFSPATLAGLGLIALLAGFGAGIFPAFVLSAFEPVRTVRGRLMTGTRGQALRKGLVVAQFAIAVVMIVGVTVVVRQIDYLKTKDLGFNRDMLVVVPAGGPANDALRDRLRQHPNVRSVSFDVSIPGQFTGDATYLPEGRSQEDTFRTSSFFVGYDFLKTYEIELLHGRDFSLEFPSDAQEGLIINETAARELGWGEDAVGREVSQFTANGVVRRRIVGVVRDFHHKSLATAIDPTSLRLNPAGFNFASVRIAPADVPATLAFLEATFKEFLPQVEYRHFFIDDDFRLKYPNEERVRSVAGFFGIMAIFVACLGLFGLATFVIERRTKEIGIRKALGAGVHRIVLSLSGEFLRAVLLANLVAWPLAFYLMSGWLRTFAYRISFAWWFLALAGLLSVAVAFFTVSWHSVRSARANPVDALRFE